MISNPAYLPLGESPTISVRDMDIGDPQDDFEEGCNEGSDLGERGVVAMPFDERKAQTKYLGGMGYRDPYAVQYVRGLYYGYRKGLEFRKLQALFDREAIDLQLAEFEAEFVALQDVYERISKLDMDRINAEEDARERRKDGLFGADET